jgi:putative transposase
MARKHRHHSGNGAYHVYNRAELGLPILGTDNAKQIFLDITMEVAEIFNWQLHAFAIMSNHFHLVVTTPHGNLPEGMHRLQSSFANKHKIYRDSPGHVFQSRYRSHHYPPGLKTAAKIDYVHLNPVRAGIVTLEQLKSYPWTSYRKLWTTGDRGPLTIGLALESFHGIKDERVGWNLYEESLRLLLVSDSRILTEAELFGIVRRRRRGALSDVRPISQLTGKSTEVFKDEMLQRWNDKLEKVLLEIGRSSVDVGREGKCAVWKIKLAQRLIKEVAAPSSWVACKLAMGSGSNVRRLISES